MESIGKISLAAGCFWCTEGILSQIHGVIHTEIGYGGGQHCAPTYRSVSAAPDGHAEITVVTYDRRLVSLSEILDVFYAMHDPSKTFQINDKKGELYRSVILYHSIQDERAIRKYVDKLTLDSARPIRTEILPFQNYKPADTKYQQYYATNPNKPFCQRVIGPKIEALRKRGILRP